MRHPASALVLALILLALVPATAAAQTTVVVNVVNNDFVNPATGLHYDPVITQGDTVRWVWFSGPFSAHSTTSVSGQPEQWDSGIQGEPFTFDHLFTTVGTSTYICSLHGFDLGGGNAIGMSGQVVVQAAPVPEPTC
jgi:plastocyanin